MRTPTYPSDLSDEQWAVVEPLIPGSSGGRPRETSMRDVLDAIFYVLRTGCQWRFLPKDFPPKSTVWGYLDAWRHNGTLGTIQQALHAEIRRREHLPRSPATGRIDSQSVPASEGGEQRGYDAAKKVKGRKRHIVVDSLGLLIAVVVTAAGVDDAQAAPHLLGQLTEAEFPRLRQMWADQKYHNHALAAWAEEHSHFELRVVRRPDGAKGFVLLPKRWVVERTFAWLKRCRRLSVDREKSVRSCEAMIRLAMIHLMLNRLCPKGGEPEFRYRKAA